MRFVLRRKPFFGQYLSSFTCLTKKVVSISSELICVIATFFAITVVLGDASKMIQNKSLGYELHNMAQMVQNF